MSAQLQHSELLAASVTSRQVTVSQGWLLLWEQDLHGSDLENMSLSKRFLKEGRKEKLVGMEGTSDEV